ncbi:MAG: alanine:cation symporter family protein [Polyangiales bacterium]
MGAVASSSCRSCRLYLLAGLWVLLSDAEHILPAFATIWHGAFTPDGIVGGALGVLVIGFRRAAFSNRSGCWFRASIAHSAAATGRPIREGSSL